MVEVRGGESTFTEEDQAALDRLTPEELAKLRAGAAAEREAAAILEAAKARTASTGLPDSAVAETPPPSV